MNLLYFFRNNLLSFLFITLSTLSWSQTTITSAATGNWSNTASWVGGVVPVLGDNVVIAAGHTVTLTIGVNIGTGNLTVSGEIALAGFNLTAGSLSGDGNIGSTSGTPTLTVGSNNSNTTFSGVYSGVGANLAKEGTGVLTLSGLNTYTGTTNIRGTISISNIADGGVACNLGQASSSSTNIRLNGGGILYNGPSASTDRGITQSNTAANSIEVANGSSLTINGAITGEGVSSGFNKLGLGTLILGGTNTYAGTTTISSGILSIGSGGTTGNIVGNITNNSNLIVNRSNAYAYSGVISGTGTVTKEGSGVFTVSGVNTYTGATTINAGTLQLSTGNDRISNSSALTVASGATFDMNGRIETVASIAGAGTVRSSAAGAITLSSGGDNSSTTFSGVIQNGSATSIAITKTGSGTLTLTGANTYTGATTISGGSISIGDGGTTGSIAGNITNNAALIINRSNAYTYSGVISGNGTVTKEGSGVFTISGANTYTGATTINAGTLQLSTGNDRISNSSALTVASGATFDMNGRTETVASIAGAGTITSSAAGAVTLTNGGANTTIFSGIIQNGSGTIALTKSGSGTLTLSGANTYTGNTSISAGTLIANNATAIGAGALVTVSGTGTLRTDVSLALNRLTISATTAKVNLNGNNSTTTRLTLATAVQPSGTHGSTASAATFKNNSFFTSTSSGVLTVNDCAFSVEVVTTAANQTVSLPLLGNSSVTVYWGDGLNDTYTSSGAQTHVYSVAGTYTVNVFGSFTQFGTGTFLATPTRITKVLDWGCTGLTSLPAAFINATGLIDVPSYLPAGVTNLSSTFRGATSFNDPDVVSWNTSAVTNMSSTFLGASVFNQDIGGWNTANVSNMAGMFNGATAFNQNIGGWNTSLVTNMQEMFNSASSFNNGGSNSINNWNTSAVVSMTRMFASASAFNQPLGLWNTGSVTSMTQMFDNADSFNQPIGTWNTSNVIGIDQMFLSNNAFNQPIGTWNLASVTNMRNMFTNATVFNNGGSDNINNWNTSSVTNMAGMFSGAVSFNQPIGSWNTAAVTNMSSMFSGAINFNQDIGSWNTAAVTGMGFMFNSASLFNNGGSSSIEDWNTGAVISMNYMFAGTTFNQDIGNWSTGSVTTMDRMFASATAFNQNIASWNTGAVTMMAGMFLNATAFNQNIGSWTLNATVNMSNMLDYSGMDCANYAATLVGWNSNSSTPNNRTLGAMFVEYDASAVAARTNLLGTKGWSIIGDALCGTNYGAFITRWNLATTGSGPTQLSVRTATSGTVNYFWEEVGGGATGSGSFSGTNLTIIGLPADATIRLFIYPTNFQRIVILNEADRSRLLDVEQWGTTVWTSMAYAFMGCNNLNITATDIPILTSCTSMLGMFESCTSLNGPSNINSWNTAAVISMQQMFSGATAFNQNIGDWNTAAVTSMTEMFFGSNSFNQNIGNWNTASVTLMSKMFYGALAFNQNIGEWNTGGVTNMFEMFWGAQSFNQNIGNWNLNANVNLNGMLVNSGMDCANYTATLVGWNANLNCPTGRTLGASGRTYGTAAVAARANLVLATGSGGRGWTITDGGLAVVITSQSTGTQTRCLNFPFTPITVTATGVGLTYQWFSNTTASTTGGTSLGAANGAQTNSYTPQSTVAGTLYYYCIVSVTCGSATSSVSGAFVTNAAFISGEINSTGETICNGGTPATTIGSVTSASGGNNTITYTWRSSADSYTAAISGANSATYLPPVGLTATTSYRRYAVDGTCNTTPTVAIGTWTVTVDPVSVGGTVSGSTAVCSGTNSTQLTLAGNTGVVTKWQSSTTSDFSTGVTDISNTSTILTATDLIATTYYRAVIGSGVCSTANSSTGTITVDPVSVGGTVSGDTSICPGTNSTTLTLAGNTGAVTKWQSSTTSDFSSGVTDISNTTTSLIATNLTVTTYYRAVIGSGVCSTANSTTGSITVYTNCYDWISTSSTNWNLASNWGQNEVPSENARIRIAPSATANIVLDQNRKIESLNLNQRGLKVILGNRNLIINGTIEGENLTSYICTNSNGSISTTLTNGATKKFPVGQSDYNPVTITNYNTTADSISVRVKDSVLLEAYSGTPVNTVNVQRTWFIKKNNANDSGVDFVFEWDTTQQSGFMPGYYLNHFEGSNWEIADFENYGQPVKNGSRVTLSMFGYLGGFSPFTFGDSPSSPLPVELLNFNAELKDRVVNLTWQTASEHNNDFFTIERSADGYNFEPILYKNGAGNSTSLMSYSDKDLQPLEGVSYYRLKQTDYDGAYEYSDIRVVSSAADAQVLIYPNPSRGSVLISANAPITNIKLITADGRILEEHPSLNELKLELTSGIYHLQYVFNEKTYSKKIVIVN